MGIMGMRLGVYPTKGKRKSVNCQFNPIDWIVKESVTKSLNRICSGCLLVCLLACWIVGCWIVGGGARSGAKANQRQRSAALSVVYYFFVFLPYQYKKQKMFSRATNKYSQSLTSTHDLSKKTKKKSYNTTRTAHGDGVEG